MLATPSETLACPDTARQHRLAAQLAYMIPGATTIRVRLPHPKQAWLHPHAIATDAVGEPIELSRTTARIATRWVLQVWPNPDRTRSRTFELATANLTRSNLAAARRGR